MSIQPQNLAERFIVAFAEADGNGDDNSLRIALASHDPLGYRNLAAAAIRQAQIDVNEILALAEGVVV